MPHRAKINMGAYITLMLLILSLICIHLSSGRQPSLTKTEYQDRDFSGGIIDRVGPGTGFECSKDVILLYQGPTSPLPSGIPTYTVEIINNCITNGNDDDSRCNVSNIHVSCGWFSTARSINPVIFRRLGYDDCLVNDGQPMNAGQCVTFEYANTFPYPLSVSSVSC